jgi:truncated hemoglobin YjbI
MDARVAKQYKMMGAETVGEVVDQLYTRVDTETTINRFDVDLKVSLMELQQLQTAHNTTPYVVDLVRDIQFLLENLKELP